MLSRMSNIQGGLKKNNQEASLRKKYAHHRLFFQTVSHVVCFLISKQQSTFIFSFMNYLHSTSRLTVTLLDRPSRITYFYDPCENVSTY